MINNELQKEIKKSKFKKLIIAIIILIIIPLLIVAGIGIFGDRSYNLISAIIAFLGCVPFFISFEKRKRISRELVVIAVLIGMSVLGRFIFTPIPGFKPVTAIVIIAAVSLGAEAGFIIGALSALISNFYFGQGPWTPFQMFSWGIIGFIVGVIAKTGVMKKPIALIVSGISGGVLYSLTMDIWTVLSIDGVFNLKRYLAAIAASLPWMGVYAFSNVIFLLLLAKPFWEKLDRIKAKYNLFIK